MLPMTVPYVMESEYVEYPNEYGRASTCGASEQEPDIFKQKIHAPQTHTEEIIVNKETNGAHKHKKNVIAGCA